MKDRRRGRHALARPRGGARSGFSLLEILTVILIISILATYLVVNVPVWVDNAKMTACEQNMMRIYRYLTAYMTEHNGSFPREEGQRFFLKVWKAGLCERNDTAAKMFYCPSAPPGEWLAPDEDVTALLSDWENIGPDTTSYAGFNSLGDRSLRTKLKMEPGSVTIISDSDIHHRGGIVYLTADGTPHRIRREEIEDLGIDYGPGAVEIGPGSEFEELRTVTND